MIFFLFFFSFIFIIWRHETSARGWCTGMTQRDEMGREVGGGFRMGNTCKSMADSCQCMSDLSLWRSGVSLSRCGAQAPEHMGSAVTESRLSFSVARGDLGSPTSDQTLH